MPRGQGGERLGDDEGGAFLFQLGGGGGQGVAESDAHEPQLGLACRTEGRAGEPGEFLLGGTGGGSADLLAVDDEGFAAVVFLEAQRAAVRKRGFR